MTATNETSRYKERPPRPLATDRRHRLPKITGRRLIALGALVGVVTWLFVIISSVSVYSTQLVVVEGGTLGIPPPTENLDFGDVPRGGQLQRFITFENSGIIPTAVVLVEWGGARDFTHVSDAFFSLAPGDDKTVVFDARPPASAAANTYKGKVIAIRVPWWCPF